MFTFYFPSRKEACYGRDALCRIGRSRQAIVALHSGQLRENRQAAGGQRDLAAAVGTRGGGSSLVATARHLAIVMAAMLRSGEVWQEQMVVEKEIEKDGLPPGRHRNLKRRCLLVWGNRKGCRIDENSG